MANPRFDLTVCDPTPVFEWLDVYGHGAVVRRMAYQIPRSGHWLMKIVIDRADVAEAFAARWIPAAPSSRPLG